MKKVILTFMSLALLACLSIYSCQKNNSPSDRNEPIRNSETETTISKNTSHKSGWIPEGSKIDSFDGGYTITPPPGWSYAGYGSDQKPLNTLSLAATTVSCTCNTTGTCKPFFASGPGGSISGCGGTCTNCTMKQGLTMQDKIIDIFSGGYYSTIMATRLLKSGEKIPGMFQALYETDGFQKELQSFLRIAHNGKPMKPAIHNEDGSVSAPLGYALAAVTIMGRGLVLVLPEAYVNSKPGYYAASKASCSCSQGSCSLKDKTVLGVGAIWCEGNCTTCTLTIDNKNQHDILPIQIQAYTF